MTLPSGRKRVQGFLQNEKILSCTAAVGKMTAPFAFPDLKEKTSRLYVRFLFFQETGRKMPSSGNCYINNDVRTKTKNIGKMGQKFLKNIELL